MNIAIVGGRDFSDYDLVEKTIFEELKLSDISLVVSGGARGADSLGEQFAKIYSIKTLIFKPDWKKFGKAAGHIRNRDIIENSDFVFAFWDGKSKGTANSINITKQLNKKIKVTSYGTA